MKSSIPAARRAAAILWSVPFVMNLVLPASAEESEHASVASSVNVLMTAGSSSEDNDVIQDLQGGGHDPKRRGFTLQQVEWAISGAFAPYFEAETHVILGEDEVELEEAFLTAAEEDSPLHVKAGYFLSEFGLVNPTHPHSWPWVDQPLIASRLLGPDGSRATGARVGWQLPLSWYSTLLAGIQNADDETMVSFLGEGHVHGDDEADEDHGEGGEETVAGLPRTDPGTEGLEDMLYVLRWENHAALTERMHSGIGLCLMRGPNASGEDGQTTLYGADLSLEWLRDLDHHHPVVTWETEVMKRDYEADDATLPLDDGNTLSFPSTTIEDWGFYSQVIWAFSPRWEAGFRVEYATGEDEGVEERAEDAQRSDRIRLSPLLTCRPADSLRVRFQYNYDDADFLESGTAHTVWLGMEWMYGAHEGHDH